MEYRRGTLCHCCKEAEFGSEKDGYEAVNHQRFIGTGYLDATQQAITSGEVSTTALEWSTEAAQSHAAAAVPKSSEKLSARVAAD
jgi:malate synthase